ncbi:sensor histidine kinase [Lentisalinibacter salinarum]|uniref:sensor histidine kinase n=1 Tax=Lentisalinibacter salinarum TaxID=2992239 RepID=UPI00386A9488
MNSRALTTAGAAESAGAPRLALGAGAADAFWYSQLAGWSVYFLVHYAGALMDNDYAPWWASFASAVAGFVLTSAMRPILQRVWGRGPLFQVSTALGLALIFAVPYSAVSEQAYWLGQGQGWQPASVIDYLGSAFWCGSILLTWTGIYFGLTYYHEAHLQQIRAATALGQAREAKLAALRERLSPHFLFNTLNGISTLVLEGQQERAAAMLDQLSRLLRHSIEEAPAQFVTLAEELELAELYLAIQQTRFEDRLNVRWDIDPATRVFMVPPLLLQPLLENAVRYGVQRSGNRRTTISVSAVLEHAALRVRVHDDGHAVDTGVGGSGVGHRLTRERLAACYGMAAHLEVGRDNDGYTACLSLPSGTMP